MISRDKFFQFIRNSLVFFAWSIFSIVIWEIIRHEREKVFRLEHNFSMTKGIITGMRSEGRGSRYLLFEFQARGRKYSGMMNIDNCST
jgi:hypothetical protein